jgi:hypothetical protein
MIKRSIALASALSCAFVALPLQSVFAAEMSINTIEALSFLSGTWEGNGWIRQGPSAPQNFNSREVVEAKAGGRVLTITGKHTAADTGRLVHDAFAVVSPGASAQSYRMQSFLASGQSGDFQARLEQGAFIWEMTDPRGGKIRYTIRVANDQWKEVGEYSSDGARWHEFFGMSLKRVSGGTAKGAAN